MIRNGIHKAQLQDLYLHNVLVVLVLFQILRINFNNFPVGVFFTFYLLLGFIILPIEKNKKIYFNVLIFVLVLNVTLSSVVGVWFNLKLSTIITELVQSFLPAFWSYLFLKRDAIRRIMSRFVYSQFAVFVLSLYLFMTQPEFYRYFLDSIENTGTHIDLTSNYFRSIYGLTITSSFALVALIWLTNMELSTYVKFFLSIFFIAVILITGRRSAFVACLAYMFLTNFRFFITLSLLGLLLVINLDISDYFDRLLLLYEAITERSSNWVDGLSNYTTIGRGYGSAGHNSLSSKWLVPDNWYIKTLVEGGLMSILYIVVFLIISVRNIYIRNGTKAARFVVLTMLFQCVGSNILSMTFLSMVFWINFSSINIIKDENKGNISTAVS